MAIHRQLTPEGIRFCPLCGGALSRELVPPEGKPEMVCTYSHFLFYLNHNLLPRRAARPAGGKWPLAGGCVGWGERVEAAAVREAYEETGLTVDLGGLVGVYSYPNTPIVIVVYKATVTGGSLTPCHENDRVEWVTPAEIPWEELAFPSTQSALRDFLSGGDGAP